MSRFSGISLNDGRRGYFSLSISSCSTVYESLVSKAVDKAGDGLGKTEGQMRGILCGFYLITISVGELLPTVDPTIFSGIAYGIFFFCQLCKQVLCSLCLGSAGIEQHKLWGRKVPAPTYELSH